MKKQTKIILGVGAALAIAYYLKSKATSPTLSPYVANLATINPSTYSLNYNPPNFQFGAPNNYFASSTSMSGGIYAASSPIGMISSDGVPPTTSPNALVATIQY